MKYNDTYWSADNEDYSHHDPQDAVQEAYDECFWDGGEEPEFYSIYEGEYFPDKPSTYVPDDYVDELVERTIENVNDKYCDAEFFDDTWMLGKREKFIKDFKVFFDLWCNKNAPLKIGNIKNVVEHKVIVTEVNDDDTVQEYEFI